MYQTKLDPRQHHHGGDSMGPDGDRGLMSPVASTRNLCVPHFSFPLTVLFLALLLLVLTLHGEVNIAALDELGMLVIPASGNWQVTPSGVLAQSDPA
jgi:hypothetical protein